MEATNYYHRRLRNKLIFGSLIVIIGFVLLGLNFGFIPQVWKPILFSWQMLLILWGVIELCHARFFRGIIWMFIGGFFLIPALGNAFPEYFRWASESFIQVNWPILLIAAGSTLIVYSLLPKKYRRRRRWRHHHEEKHFHWFQPHGNVGYKRDCDNNGEDGKSDFNARKSTNCRKGNGILNKSVIFAGSDEIFLDEVFTGGELDAVCGGINLDLRHTTLPEGETYLVMNAVCGGINIYVPDTWDIDVRADAIAGGFVDSRLINKENIDRSRKLIITGSFVLGGGEIK